MINCSRETTAVLALSYDVEDNFKLDVDQDQFESLCRTLLVKAAERIVEGEVVLGVNRASGDLTIRVESKGARNFDCDLDLREVEPLSQSLNGRIAVDEGDTMSIAIHFDGMVRSAEDSAIRAL